MAAYADLTLPGLAAAVRHRGHPAVRGAALRAAAIVLHSAGGAAASRLAGELAGAASAVLSEAAAGDEVR